MRDELDLKRELGADWLDLVKRIRASEDTLVPRIEREGLLLDYDAEQDRLRILIGGVPAVSYAQGRDHVYLDLDVDDDSILGITIREIATFDSVGRLPPAVLELLPSLRRLGQIRIPPMSQGSREVAREMREFVPI